MIVPMRQYSERSAASDIESAVLEAERRVLGHLLLVEGGFMDVMQKLKPHHFLDPAHRAIARVIWGLAEKGLPHLAPEVLLALSENRMGKYTSQVLSISQTAGLSSELPYLASKVSQASSYRRLALSASEMASKCATHSGSPTELLRDLVEQVGELESEVGESLGMCLSGRASQMLAQMIEEKGKNRGHAIDVGLLDLKECVGSLHPGAYVSIAAKEKCGKSALALQIASGAAMAGKTVIYFALEMTESECFSRLLSRIAGVNFSKVEGLSGLDVDEIQDVKQAAIDIESMNLWILTAHRDISSIEEVCRLIKDRHGLDMIVVDYEDKVRTAHKGAGYFERSKEVSGRLRDLAIDLDCVVLGVNIFSGSHTPQDRPKPEWIAGGGHKRHDPTHLILLYRPEAADPRRIRAIVPYVRGYKGRITECLLKFWGEFMMFQDYYDGDKFRGLQRPKGYSTGAEVAARVVRGVGRP